MDPISMGIQATLVVASYWYGLACWAGWWGNARWRSNPLALQDCWGLIMWLITPQSKNYYYYEIQQVLEGWILSTINKGRNVECEDPLLSRQSNSFYTTWFLSATHHSYTRNNV